MAGSGEGAARGQESKAPAEVRIYAHSQIIHWWMVWLYGYVCALITYLEAKPLDIGSTKPVLIDSNPWLGLSFTLLLLVVIVATTVRARGGNALLLIAIMGGAMFGTYFVMQLDHLWTSPPALLLHMNLAFYLLVSSVLFSVWVAIVFVFDRLSYWRFRSTQVERVQRFATVLGGAPQSWSVMHVRLTRFSDDIIANKFLGLGILGLGTSDIDVKLSLIGGGSEQFRIGNVWRAAGPLKQIEALMGAKATVVT